MNNQRLQFRAPWDLLLVVMTIGITALLIGVAHATGILWVMLMNWIIVVVCIAFGVYGYSIQDGKLKILRLGWSKDISLNEIQRVESKPNGMMGSVRLFGIGGVFGYIGKFKNSILGSYRAYVTHRRKTVLIVTKDRQKTLISPDDPVQFLKSLKIAIRNETEAKDRIDDIFREAGLGD